MNKSHPSVVKEALGILARLMIIVLLLGFIGSILQGCSDQCETYYTYTEYQPVTVNLDQMRKAVKMKSPRELHHPGKIYRKEPWLFISEAGEGIHIIDNSNKSNPVVKAFLNIPGCYDMAVLGNVLYADSYIDLLAFDITDVENIRQLDRQEDVFKSRLNHHYQLTSANELVVDYTPVQVEREYEADCDDEVYSFWGRNEDVAFADGGGGGRTSSEVVNQAGQGGSMARFTLAANHLYAVDASSLYVFDLANPFTPTKQNEVPLGWNIETIFPYQDKLFVGASNGLHILDNSDPSNPRYAAVFAHATACDPVVVENDIAYVTLRTGNACDGFINQLDVVDVADIYNPKPMTSYPMQNPHGLGIHDGRLFLCEGEFGLKIFDATDSYKIAQNLINHKEDMHAYDVIPYQQEEILMLIGDDGFYQYDYSDIQNIRLLSHIAVVVEEE
jgi:hypothetical protein